MHRIVLKGKASVKRDGVVQAEIMIANIPVANDRAWAIETVRKIAALHKAAGSYHSMKITELGAEVLNEEV